MYDLYSKFDMEQHKKHYIHYLEVVMFPDGHIEYAVPSHQEKLINICCENMHISRQELANKCPEEYYFDFVTWLCKISNCISIWTNFIVKPDTITNAQYQMLQKIKDIGIYEGDL